MFYYTYVLKSGVDSKLYIGYTKELQKRIKEHNAGKVPSTKSRRPLRCIYYEACLDERDAIHREKYFKMGFGRHFLKQRMSHNLHS